MPASIDPPEPTPEETFRDDVAIWPEGAARQYRRGDWGEPTAYHHAVADGLDAFAAFVRALPADDPRLRELARLSLPWPHYNPSDMALVALRDYHDSRLSPDALLDRLVRLAWHEHERSDRAPPADADQTDDTPTT